METEACRAALLIAVQQGWSDIDLESDKVIVLWLLLLWLILLRIDRIFAV